jgi:hypothetical protein
MPAAARDVLGVFGGWGAFRDPAAGRCYAIARPQVASTTTGRWQPFLAIGSWPKQGVRGQVNLRLSREMARSASAKLTIGEQSFELAGGGADLWAPNRQADAAIIAAIRSGSTLIVNARGVNGGSIRESYALRGAATAIDAAALGCARVR